MFFFILYSNERFVATPAQRVGAATAALALVAVAFAIKAGPRAAADGAVPRPWLLDLIGFVWSGMFFARPGNWIGVAMGVGLVAVAAAVVAH